MVSLYQFANAITLSQKIYLKKQHKLIELFEVKDDLYKLQLYKDYVPAPFIKDEEIEKAFLDHYHLEKEKKQFCESDDFDLAFDRYIHDYSRCMLGFTMYELYWDFRHDYLRPIAVKWLEQNKIPYEDDLGKVMCLF